MKIHGENDFAKMIGQRPHNSPYAALELAPLDRVSHRRIDTGNEIDKLIAGELRRRICIVGNRSARLFCTESVTRFVGGDLEKPRPEMLGGIEGIGLLKNLDERVLQNIFRERGVTKKSDEEIEELAAMPGHQRPETSRVAIAVARYQLLVSHSITPYAAAAPAAPTPVASICRAALVIGCASTRKALTPKGIGTKKLSAFEPS